MAQAVAVTKRQLVVGTMEGTTNNVSAFYIARKAEIKALASHFHSELAIIASYRPYRSHYQFDPPADVADWLLERGPAQGGERVCQSCWALYFESYVYCKPCMKERAKMDKMKAKMRKEQENE